MRRAVNVYNARDIIDQIASAHHITQYAQTEESLQELLKIARESHAKYMNLTVSGCTVTARAMTDGALSSLLSE